MLVEFELKCFHVTMIAYRQQNDSMKVITLRCSDEEYNKLQTLASKQERSMNEILREFIRSLESKPSVDDGALDPFLR